MFGIEVQLMDRAGQVLRKIDVSFDEGLVDNKFGGDVGELGISPLLHLLGHGLEVALHFGHADLKRVYEIEVLRMLGEHWRKVTGECHVVADQHSILCAAETYAEHRYETHPFRRS